MRNQRKPDTHIFPPQCYGKKIYRTELRGKKARNDFLLIWRCWYSWSTVSCRTATTPTTCAVCPSTWQCCATFYANVTRPCGNIWNGCNWTHRAIPRPAPVTSHHWPTCSLCNGSSPYSPPAYPKRRCCGSGTWSSSKETTSCYAPLSQYGMHWLSNDSLIRPNPSTFAYELKWLDQTEPAFSKVYLSLEMNSSLYGVIF